MIFFEDKFESYILDRGYRYFTNDKVGIICENDGQYNAHVTGSRIYEVEITINGAVVDDMYCTCPYADSGRNCKHMAAVLYMISGNEPDESEPFGIDVLDVIEQAGKREVYEFLNIEMSYDQGMLERFIDFTGYMVGELQEKEKKPFTDAVRIARGLAEGSDFFVKNTPLSIAEFGSLVQDMTGLPDERDFRRFFDIYKEYNGYAERKFVRWLQKHSGSNY